MLLSVIIPVYHVEQTLQRCVESVLQQDVNDMEVILVDDGSPDNCPRLCDEWAEKDRRIKVIHKENGGLSDARNAGIEMSRGKYLTFVDSDDYLAPNTYQPLLDILQKHPEYDILEYPVAGKFTWRKKQFRDVNEYWLEGKAYLHTFAWNKIYRRKLFEDVRFPKGKVFEDVYTLPQLLRFADVVATTDVGGYHYCYNPNGITAQASGEDLAMLLEAHLQSGMPLDDRYYLHLVNIQMDVWERLGCPILLPDRKLNPQLFTGKEKVKVFMLNILGINILCRINKLIHLFKKPSHW